MLAECLAVEFSTAPTPDKNGVTGAGSDETAVLANTAYGTRAVPLAPRALPPVTTGYRRFEQGPGHHLGASPAAVSGELLGCSNALVSIWMRRNLDV